MPTKRNPLGLNKLQLRTLAIAQVLAGDESLATRDEATGAVTLMPVPRPHGDHVHVGKFTLSARDASGLANPAVWKALTRKGLADGGSPPFVVLTSDGMAYDTGHGDIVAGGETHE